MRGKHRKLVEFYKGEESRLTQRHAGLEAHGQNVHTGTGRQPTSFRNPHLTATPWSQPRQQPWSPGPPSSRRLLKIQCWTFPLNEKFNFILALCRKNIFSNPPMSKATLRLTATYTCTKMCVYLFLLPQPCMAKRPEKPRTAIKIERTVIVLAKCRSELEP